MPRAQIALVLALGAALLHAGCPRLGSRPAGLSIAAVRQPATSLYYVARDAGCFAREALELDEKTFELGRDALEELRRGTVDVAVAYETPLLRAALADGRLRVLTKLHTSTANTRMITRREAGVRGFADLRDRSIGLAHGTNAEFFAELALALGGVPRGGTRFVDLQPDASIAALVRGEVDAAVLSDPYAQVAEAALGEGGATLVTELYVEASLLITRSDVLEAKEPALRALVRGLACAERFARERGAEARAFVQARFPGQSPEALSAQLARVTWGLGLDNVLVDILRRERDWLAPSVSGAAPPELDRILEPRVLEAVDPESVTLIPPRGEARW